MADDPKNQQQFAEDVLAAVDQDGGMNFVNSDGNSQMPSIEEVWKIIEQMEGLSDDERAKLKESLHSSQHGSVQELIKRYADPIVGHTSWDYMIFIAMIVILFLIFGKNKEKLMLK